MAARLHPLAPVHGVRDLSHRAGHRAVAVPARRRLKPTTAAHMDKVTRYRLLDLTIDLARQRVERGGTPLDVAGLSFQLLACLVERGDRVVGFDELMSEV